MELGRAGAAELGGGIIFVLYGERQLGVRVGYCQK